MFSNRPPISHIHIVASGQYPHHCSYIGSFKIEQPTLPGNNPIHVHILNTFSVLPHHITHPDLNWLAAVASYFKKSPLLLCFPVLPDRSSWISKGLDIVQPDFAAIRKQYLELTSARRRKSILRQDRTLFGNTSISCLVKHYRRPVR